MTWGLPQIAIAGVPIFLLLALRLITWASSQDEPENVSNAVLLSEVAIIIFWNLAIIGIIYWLVRRNGGGWRSLGLPAAPGGLAPGMSFRSLALIVIGAYFSTIVFVQTYGFALDLLGLDDLLPAQQIPNDIYDNSFILAAFAVVGVTFVPFAEELYFRGFAYAALRRWLALPVAALVNGLLFSVAHGDPGLILPFTGVGAILAYSYERTRTLLVPIGIHTLFNLVSLLVLAFVPGARPD